MKTTLPQAPAFRAYLAGVDDGAKRDFTPVGYERARLAYIASTLRYPGHVADWPLETPFGGDSPLDARLLALRSAPWLGLVGDDELPFLSLIDDLRGVAAGALGWFDEFRFPPMDVDARTGVKLWPAGVTRRRLPTAVHREARRLAGELSLPWPWDIIDNSPDIERLGSQRGELNAPLQFRHLVALAALMLLREAADVLTAEGARLQSEFHRLAPRVRIGAGWRSEAWGEVAQHIGADERNRLKASATLRIALQLQERAEGWLSAWCLMSEADRETREAAETATQAQIEAARLARQEAAARGAQGWADQARQETQRKIAAAYARLLPDQRGRFAAGIIAESLDLNPRTVRVHLKELHLLGSKSNGR